MSQNKIIDIHQHYFKHKYSIEDLISHNDKNGIKHVCLSSCGAQFNQPNNDEVAEAVKKYPEKITGFGYFKLGEDWPEYIDVLHKMGFRGLKMINPRKNYSDKEYYPVYAKAQALKMPILFHTGFVARQENDHLYDVASERMQPIFLDTIARAFPKLIIIGAHLGVPWYNEACVVVRANPNVYYDLSGAITILSECSDTFFETLTYWDMAKERLLYGTDTYYDDIPQVITSFNKLFNNRGFSDQLRDKILFQNAADILKSTL